MWERVSVGESECGREKVWERDRVSVGERVGVGENEWERERE